MCELLPNSAFLHIPKCGGVWIRETLRQSGLSQGELHSTVPRESTEGITHSWHCVPSSSEAYQSKRHVFTFIRHPVTWYQSYYAFRKQEGNWNEYNYFDEKTEHDTFEGFIDSALNSFPEGHYANLCAFYIKESTLVGVLENVFVSLLRILMDTGDYWHTDHLVTVAPQNVTSSKAQYRYRPDQIERIFEVEKDIIGKFYAHTEPLHFMQLAS